MDKYICTYCGYIYDPELGVYEQKIEVRTEWEQVPKTFKCPIYKKGEKMELRMLLAGKSTIEGRYIYKKYIRGQNG